MAPQHEDRTLLGKAAHTLATVYEKAGVGFLNDIQVKACDVTTLGGLNESTCQAVRDVVTARNTHQR